MLLFVVTILLNQPFKCSKSYQDDADVAERERPTSGEFSFIKYFLLFFMLSRSYKSIYKRKDASTIYEITRPKVNNLSYLFPYTHIHTACMFIPIKWKSSCRVISFVCYAISHSQCLYLSHAMMMMMMTAAQLTDLIGLS